MQYMFNAGTDVIVVGGKEHLRFVFEPAKRKRMDNLRLIAEVLVAQIGRMRVRAGEVNFALERIFYHKIMIP